MNSTDNVLQEAQKLIDEKQFEQAEVLLRSFYQDEMGRRRKTGLLISQSLEKQGKKDAAKAFLSEMLLLWPKAINVRCKYAKICAEMGLFAEAVTVLEGVALERLPAGSLLLLVQAKIKIGDFFSAVEVFQGIVTPLQPPLQKKALNLALILATEPSLNIDSRSYSSFVETAAEISGGNGEFERSVVSKLYNMAVTCWFEGEERQAIELLTRVTSSSLLHQSVTGAEAVLRLAEFLVSEERYPEAQKALHHIQQVADENICRIRDYLMLLCASGGTTKDNKEKIAQDGILVPDEQFFDGAIQHYRFGNERCVVWFNSIILANATRRLSMVLPLMQSRGISVFAVTDKRRAMSMAGIGPYFPNRSDTREALQKELAARGYVSVATVGTSGAGLSALLYGAEMGAEGILGFSAVTKLPDEDESNPQAIMHRDKLLGKIEVTPSNSRGLVAQSLNTKIFLCFPEKSDFDAVQAHNLTGLANVTFWPEPHDSHDVIGWLLKNDHYTERIEAFFDEIGW